MEAKVAVLGGSDFVMPFSAHSTHNGFAVINAFRVFRHA